MPHPGAQWPDEADAIVAGDQAVVLAYCTPARGVVLSPVTNFAVRDRDAGTLTNVNTSVGAPKKLERIRSNPNVALAFHTRAHATAPDRPEYVLVQGRATVSDPHPDYPRTIEEEWERKAGKRDTNPLLEWWLRDYHHRVGITTAVERMVIWPDLACQGEPSIHGTPLPEHPEPQRPPRNGTGPRVDHEKVARHARRLPNVLLGWVGGDGLPVVVPVEVEGTTPDGLHLRAPRGADVPPGGRRAGLTAHAFTRHVVGQDQRVHTGWLEHDARTGRLLYAPHTELAYRIPDSRLLFELSAGAGTRYGRRDGGHVARLPHRILRRS